MMTKKSLIVLFAFQAPSKLGYRTTLPSDTYKATQTTPTTRGFRIIGRFPNALTPEPYSTDNLYFLYG